MTNLEKLYAENMGFQAVVDSLAIWFCDETMDVSGSRLYDWMLAGADVPLRSYKEACEYATKMVQEFGNAAATAYVIGYCDATDRNLAAMLADCGLGLHGE